MPAPGAAAAKGAKSDLRRVEGRPPVVVVARAGDPRAAIAVAISTEGIAPERAAEPAAAIAALVEARVKGASVATSGLGVRARVLVASDPEATSAASAMAAGLLAPVEDAEVAIVRRRLAMLARRPLADAALAPAAECAGDAVGGPGEATNATRESIEAWRRAAVGLGRVAFATTGAASVADAVTATLARGPAWPSASPAAEGAPLPIEARVYDATGSDVAAGAVRATLAARVDDASRAVAAAERLGDPRGALASRLGGLDAPAKIHDVTATAHARGGCLVVAIDFAPRDLAVDAAARVATAIVLARQEIAVEVSEAGADDDAAAEIARRAGDPRDAAERAAWWALSTKASARPAGRSRSRRRWGSRAGATRARRAARTTRAPRARRRFAARSIARSSRGTSRSSRRGRASSRGKAKCGSRSGRRAGRCPSRRATRGSARRSRLPPRSARATRSPRRAGAPSRSRPRAGSA